MKLNVRSILTAIIGTGVCAVTTASADRVFPAWAQIYDFSVTRSQFARAVAVDSRGNVAVTGYIFDESNTQALYVAKYDTLNAGPDDGPQGKLIWERSFRPASQTAEGKSVACDSEGNVIVTGWVTTANNQKDYVTIKYSAADGTALWTKFYNNPLQNGGDEGLRVTADSADSVIVTGKSQGSGTNEDIYTVKYLANGDFSWARRYNHPGNRNDFPSSIGVDANNNVVVAGSANATSGEALFYTAKYRASDGANNVAGAWEKIAASGAQGVTDMAVDSAGNVIVTGTSYISSGFNKDIQTIKYQAATGNVAWTRVYPTLETKSWAGVAVDANGEVFVTGTSSAEINTPRIYTTKYSGVNGATVASFGEVFSPAPDSDDEATGIAVDPAGNPVVIGRSNSVDDDFQNEFYIVRYSGTDGTIRRGEELVFNGNDSGGDDIPVGIAMDRFGGFAVVGTIKKPRAEDSLFYNAIATIKFNRLLAVTGDPVSGTDVPENAKLASLSTPAVADDGGVVARMTLAAGKKKLGAIYSQGATGLPEIKAVQGGDAPGEPAAKYKSFLDPVISQSGKFAMIAALQTSPSAKPSFAVFSDISGTLTRHLQQGQEIPGLPGLTVKSFSGISTRGAGLGAQLVVLATVTGPEINKTNNVVLLGVNLIGTVTKLLRTGEDELTVDGVASKVASITTLTSAKGSAGHGRWQSNARIAARVTLEDHRTVLVTISANGTVRSLLASGAEAPLFGSGAQLKTLGLPTVGTTNVVAALASATGEDLPTSADTGLLYTTDAGTFSFLAREGDAAAGVPDAKYAGFGEPVVSATNGVAFLGTLAGGDVKSNNKTGIWSGALLPSFQAPNLLARQGEKAPDSRGEPGNAAWTNFLSLAHPGGANSGPIFLAKVAGKKNNIGLWAQDSTSKLRQAIRVGDSLGGQVVTKVTLLQGTAGVAGATRSFNTTGGVAVLLSFKDKTQAIYYLGIP